MRLLLNPRDMYATKVPVYLIARRICMGESIRSMGEHRPILSVSVYDSKHDTHMIQVDEDVIDSWMPLTKNEIFIDIIMGNILIL